MTRPADMSQEKLAGLTDNELDGLKIKYNIVKSEYHPDADGFGWASKDISVVEDEIRRRRVEKEKEASASKTYREVFMRN